MMTFESQISMIRPTLVTFVYRHLKKMPEKRFWFDGSMKWNWKIDIWVYFASPCKRYAIFPCAFVLDGPIVLFFTVCWSIILQYWRPPTNPTIYKACAVHVCADLSLRWFILDHSILSCWPQVLTFRIQDRLGLNPLLCWRPLPPKHCLSMPRIDLIQEVRRQVMEKEWLPDYGWNSTIGRAFSRFSIANFPNSSSYYNQLRLA